MGERGLDETPATPHDIEQMAAGVAYMEHGEHTGAFAGRLLKSSD